MPPLCFSESFTLCPSSSWQDVSSAAHAARRCRHCCVRHVGLWRTPALAARPRGTACGLAVRMWSRWPLWYIFLAQCCPWWAVSSPFWLPRRRPASSLPSTSPLRVPATRLPLLIINYILCYYIYDVDYLRLTVRGGDAVGDALEIARGHRFLELSP